MKKGTRILARIITILCGIAAVAFLTRWLSYVLAPMLPQLVAFIVALIIAFVMVFKLVGYIDKRLDAKD